MLAVPDRSEAASYYFTYIDQAPAGDIRKALRAQLAEMDALLRGVSDQTSLHRYAPGKWSIRDVVCHLSDAERVFAFRAFWFVRGLPDPLPSFDQQIAAPAARADDRSWASLIDEFRSVRLATVALFDGLAEEAWDRRGVASGHPVTVRALAYVIAGHVAHHAAILRTRYLQAEKGDS